MNTTKEHNTTGLQYFYLALSAFTAFGIEVLLAFFIEPAIYGRSMQEWSATQNIAHWIITCLAWGIAAVYIVRFAKRKYQFDIFSPAKKVVVWQWMLIAVCLLFSGVVSYMSWNGFKIIKEFQNKGWLLFIFQYIYYLFETLLFTLIVVFGQKACEVWFKRENFPYGGIAVALMWGLAHIFTKDITTGLLSALGGFIFGCIYLLVNRDIKKTAVLLFILFVI